MPIINLADIAETLEWHNQRDEHDHPGIFVKLPREIARQFPVKSDDPSPAHITLCILDGSITGVEEKLVAIVQEVCRQFKPFVVKLGKVKKFDNAEGEMIIHSAVKSGKLLRFHEALKQTLRANQVSVDSKYPDYVPHITIGKAKTRKEARALKENQPQGEFMVSEIWIWGGRQPQLITLGR
jgi:2'-5' RNA ligase